jgi:carbon storage regulator
MLVLSRKKNEVIRFGTEIKLIIVEIRGDKVRLGIEAPKHIQIHREEVFNAIQLSGVARETCEQLPEKKLTSLEDRTILALLDLLFAEGNRVTDEMRSVVARCSADFSSMIFLVKA